MEERDGSLLLEECVGFGLKQHSLTSGDVEVFAHLESDRSRAAVHGVVWSGINALLPVVLNGSVFIVTSRYLTPSEFGLVALAMSLTSFVGGVSPVAFADALVQRQSLRRSHIDTVFWLCLGASLLLYGSVIASGSLFAKETGQPLIASLLPILGIRLIFDSVGAVPAALIARSMRFYLFTLRTLISTIFSAAICLAMIFNGFGLWSIVAAQVTTSAASCIASFWSAGWTPGLRIRRQSLIELSHYGLFASANRFLQVMSLDQIILGIFAGPRSLGILNFSRRLYQMILDVVSGALTSVTHTLFASLQTELEKARKAFLLTTFVCSLVAFPTFMGLAAVAGDAIPIVFGKQWAAAIWPVRGFCVIGLMAGIGVVQSSLITSLGRANWWFYYQLVRNILTVATMWFLWPYGVNVIVLAMVIQVVALWPINVWMVSRVVPLALSDYLRQFSGPVLAYLALLAATASASWLLSAASPWLRLALEISAGAVAYLLVIFLSCRVQLAPVVTALLASRKSAAQ